MRIPGVLISMAVLAAGTHATEHRVSFATEIDRLIAAGLQPGDEVVMSDGTWANQKIVFAGSGTSEMPITLRAATDGKATLTGNSSLEIKGEHLAVRGIHVQDGQMTGDGIRISGRHCRLTDSAVIDGTYKFFVHIIGTRESRRPLLSRRKNERFPHAAGRSRKPSPTIIASTTTTSARARRWAATAARRSASATATSR